MEKKRQKKVTIALIVIAILLILYTLILLILNPESIEDKNNLNSDDLCEQAEITQTELNCENNVCDVLFERRGNFKEDAGIESLTLIQTSTNKQKEFFLNQEIGYMELERIRDLEVDFNPDKVEFEKYILLNTKKTICWKEVKWKKYIQKERYRL